MATEIPELVAQLERKVADLSEDVQNIKSELSSLKIKHQQSTPDSTLCDQVLALTRTLFGERVQLVEKDDPEFPTESYGVLYVRTGLPDEVVDQRENEWYKLVRAVSQGQHGYFRLAVTVDR
jgi:hypothetical protein